MYFNCYHIDCDRPALKYLNRHVVSSITSIWHDVGLELMEIEDEKEVNAIKAEDIDNKESSKRMLKLWLDKTPNASWNALINTLKSPIIGLQTLACKIEEMLLPESMYAVDIMCVISFYNTI